VVLRGKTVVQQYGVKTLNSVIIIIIIIISIISRRLVVVVVVVEMTFSHVRVIIQSVLAYCHASYERDWWYK